MRGSLFPLFWWSMSCHLVKTWATKIGKIGALSWFWHFTHGNAEGVPISRPMSWQDDKTWTTKIGEIGEIGTLSWFPAASWPTMVTTVGTFAYKQHPVFISMFWWHISSTSLSYLNFLNLLTWSCWSSSYYLTSYSEFTPCELKLSSSCL